MNRLVDLIGPAPHELPTAALISKLDAERFRISKILSRPQVKATKATPKRKPKPKTTINEAQLRAIAEATGVPLADLKRGG